MKLHEGRVSRETATFKVTGSLPLRFLVKESERLEPLRHIRIMKRE